MRRRIALLLLLCSAPASAAPAPDREKPLRDAAWAGRWIESSRLYDELAAGREPSAQAAYLAGLARWRLRRPEDARPLLQKAADAGFHAGGGRPQPEDLLAKIDSYLELRPPLVSSGTASSIELYADARTPLTAPVLDAIPRIESVGRDVFGAPPGPVRFHLFATIPPFERFYYVFAAPGMPRQGSPHSTGSLGLVIYCEEKAHRATTDETVSLALHETTHAWIATYLQNKYDRPVRVPPYVDEGLATYVAGLWSPSVAALPAQRLAKVRARGGAAPSLDELRSRDDFYAEGVATANYWRAEQLIERLIGPPSVGAKKIPPFLDALARTGDDLAAWREVSGKDARAEYAVLVSAP